MLRKEDWISSARFQPYLEECNSDVDLAWSLYEWNARVAAALSECIHHAEVLLRNAMMRELEKVHPLDYPWNTELPQVYKAAKERRSDERGAEPDDVISELTLGFWEHFLISNAANEELWRRALRFAFPGSPGRRDVVYRAVQDMRYLRNRCGHQDSLLESEPRIEVEKILSLVSWMDADARTWLEGIERATEIAATRPVKPLRDVLVLPVSKELGLAAYEKVQAYVCPQERSFAPVEYVGFYCEKKIEGYFPRIEGHILPAVWSQEEAKRLKGSDDAIEKRLGGVMGYAINNGWKAGGRYQVFLLSGVKDDSTLKRTDLNPILHDKSGRGSAFVHRHRYFGKSALIAAPSTDELT